MRNWLSWVVWTALVVAGVVSSFQIWLRAFDVGNGIPAAALKSVSPTHQRQVPAIIRRWTTPPPSPGALEPATGRHKTVPRPVHASQPATGKGVFAAGVPVASPTILALTAGEVARSHTPAPHRSPKPHPAKQSPRPPAPVIAVPVVAQVVAQVVAPTPAPAVVVQPTCSPHAGKPDPAETRARHDAERACREADKQAKHEAEEAKRAAERAKHEAEEQAKREARAAERAQHEAEERAKREAKAAERARHEAEHARHEREKRAKHEADEAKKAAERARHEAEKSQRAADERARHDAARAKHDAEKAQHDAGAPAKPPKHGKH